MRGPRRRFRDAITKAAESALRKYSPYYSGSSSLAQNDREPPYAREVPSEWIYKIRDGSSLVNNAIEEKVSQTFRRGFDELEKAWIARCVNCDHEFAEPEPFIEQAGLEPGTEIDFSMERKCPECEEMARFIEPDEDAKERVESFMAKANDRERGSEIMAPEPETDIGQTLKELFTEIGTDIQTFDDGWLIFDREYTVDSHGKVLNTDLRGMYRGAPELMRYSVDEETGNLGTEYWACLRCRHDEHYHPETEPQPCSNCGLKTYEVFAYATEDPRSQEPARWFVRGEFVHRSEYTPSRLYGFSPIVTLFDEARTLEQMDDWYRSAYEKRRAPKGAMIIRSSNADSTRSWNRSQFEKMEEDPNHVPLLMDDTEGEGDPLKYVEMLANPADMQHMEMREWFKDRISGKYGVTSVLMSGSPEESGLSQSMEVQVSNRSADRLRKLFNETFIPAVLAQLGADGWGFEVSPVEEEDEQREADLRSKKLQNAKMAQQLGLTSEWTEEDNLEIQGGEIEPMEEGMGMMGEGGPEGGMGGLMDQNPLSDESEAGQESLPSESGGQSPSEGPRPQRGAEPIKASRNGKSDYSGLKSALEKDSEIEALTDNGWVTITKLQSNGSDALRARTEKGKTFEIDESGQLRSEA